MKLSTLVAVAVPAIHLHTEGVMGASLVDRHVKSMASTHLFPEVNFGIIVDATEMSAFEGLDTYGRPFGFADLTNSPSTSYVKPREDRYRGISWLGASFLREMQEFAGIDLASPGVVDTSDDNSFYKMKMTHIVKSSPWHTDGIEGNRRGFRESWPVGFYVLNDNPHAFFEIDDDELCIPVVKGHFVTFNGNKPHHTVITDGSVDLLGPFDLKGVKCVELLYTSRSQLGHHLLPLSGPVTSVQGRRKVIEEVETVNTISGHTVYRIRYDGGVTNEITEHMLAHNITGFPQCIENCSISIALSKSQECTVETHDGASMVPLLDDLTYTTDEKEGTGLKGQSFNVESENPTGEQFLAFLKNALENPTEAQELNLSTFFYDEEGELVACSFLQPSTSDEEKHLAHDLLVAVSTTEEVENETANVAAADSDSSSGSGSMSLLSFLAIGLSTVCVLFNV